jgi:hypothetical protein
MSGKNASTATVAAQNQPNDNQGLGATVTKCKNVVTPTLEAEYLVVLLDRKLSQHQPATDAKKFNSDATYIALKISETDTAYKHRAGAQLVCTPAHVDLFLDPKCEDKDKLPANGDITDAQLRANPVLKLWLRGKTKGKFTAQFKLKDPKDAKIQIGKPVELKMGVVELEMKLHKPDMTKVKALTVHPDVEPISTYHKELKDLDLPDPIAMSDLEKVKDGRILHVQKKDSFARAKLLIKKYDQDHWPAGSDDYFISFLSDLPTKVLNIHTKEWDSSKVSEIKIKVADLKKKDHEFWLEGSAATAVTDDARFDLALDRPVGGLAKTIKRNGDWARFHVLQIQEVKVDYTTPANASPAWDSGQKRFYINMGADPQGRKITIGAKLSTKVKDVDVHFMLVPDKGNLKKANWGEDLPSTWKWKDVPAALKHKDKTNRTDFLHLTAKTDADGYAKVDLDLSRFGGDKFYPAAYLAQDAHLAKYVHGHADLKKKKPVMLEGGLQVWRKIWYQLTKPQGLVVPNADNMVDAYKRVFTEVILSQTVEFNAGNSPANTFYPESMFKPKSSSATQVANIGNVNKNAIAGKLVTQASHHVKRHLMVCIYQCDTKEDTTGRTEPIESDIHDTWVDIFIGDDKYVVDPALNGGSMIQSIYWFRQSAPGVHHALTAADARIPVPRRTTDHIQVKVPTVAPVPTAADPIFIVAKCKTAKGFLGESFNVRHTLAVYDEKEKKDYQDTITHEFGHSFNQTPRKTQQPGHPGIPNHPNQKDKGQGNHCRENNGTALLSGETKFICVMYDAGPMQWGLHRFCKVCHPYLLVEDFHKP